jgi:hypothetical protein
MLVAVNAGRIESYESRIGVHGPKGAAHLRWSMHHERRTEPRRVAASRLTPRFFASEVTSEVDIGCDWLNTHGILNIETLLATWSIVRRDAPGAPFPTQVAATPSRGRRAYSTHHLQPARRDRSTGRDGGVVSQHSYIGTSGPSGRTSLSDPAVPQVPNLAFRRDGEGCGAVACIAPTAPLGASQGMVSPRSRSWAEAGNRSRDVDVALDDLSSDRIVRCLRSTSYVARDSSTISVTTRPVLERRFSFHPSPEAGIGVVLIRALGKLSQFLADIRPV